MEINVRNSLIYIFIFFWFSSIILSDALILLVSQLQTRQLSDDVTN